MMRIFVSLSTLFLAIFFSEHGLGLGVCTVRLGDQHRRNGPRSLA